jgi:hypothetical protein
VSGLVLVPRTERWADVAADGGRVQMRRAGHVLDNVLGRGGLAGLIAAVSRRAMVGQLRSQRRFRTVIS